MSIWLLNLQKHTEDYIFYPEKAHISPSCSSADNNSLRSASVLVTVQNVHHSQASSQHEHVRLKIKSRKCVFSRLIFSPCRVGMYNGRSITPFLSVQQLYQNCAGLDNVNVFVACSSRSLTLASSAGRLDSGPIPARLITIERLNGLWARNTNGLYRSIPDGAR